MNGRFFAGQRVEADIYDGHTKYENSKTKEQLEEEEKQRLDRYAKWLESEEEREKAAKKQAAGNTSVGQEEDDERTIAADAPTP